MTQNSSSYTKYLALSVPPFTKWQPDLFHQLMVSLFSIPTPISLIISAKADPHRISWYLEVPADTIEAVSQILYAVYPRLQLTVLEKTKDWIGFRRYPFHVIQPYIFPLKYATDFGTNDPLPTLISGLAGINAGEFVAYELTLTPPTKKHLKLGEKLVQELPAEAAVKKMWQAKIDSPLKEARLAVKVSAKTEQRATELADKFLPAMALFEREGFNSLTKPGDKSFQLILSPGEAAALWHLPTDQCQTPGIVWAGSATAPIPQALTSQTQGVILGTNVYQGRTDTVRLAYPDRVTHINLVGRTRVGKSTLLHNMIHQDIAAGKGVAVIDPHGDLIDAILASSIPKTREKEVVLFDVRDKEYPIGLNLLTAIPEVSQETTASYTLAVLRRMFAGQWSSGRMETVLDAALRSLVVVPGSTIQDIPKLLLDPKFRHQVLKQVTDPATLDFWYDEYGQESPAQQREFARPITHRIRKFYRDETTRRIVCQQGSLDFRQILDKGQIFLANLGGVAEVEAETLGALLVSKIQLAAMSRVAVDPSKRTPFYLYIDEVQNFIATSLSRMFSEAGKYGLSLVVANQYLKQLEGDTLEALMGNVGTTAIFRVGPEDARALTPFVRPEFDVDDLTNLDRFMAVIKMQLSGQTLRAFTLKTSPPLMKPDDADKRIRRIRQHSRKRYGRSKEEVDAEILSRYDQEEQAEAEATQESYFG